MIMPESIVCETLLGLTKSEKSEIYVTQYIDICEKLQFSKLSDYSYEPMCNDSPSS